jgi:hypothetical protein
MQKDDFRTLADLIKEVVMNDADVKDQVKSLRKSFYELQFCFRGDEYTDVLQKLHDLL